MSKTTDPMPADPRPTGTGERGKRRAPRKVRRCGLCDSPSSSEPYGQVKHCPDCGWELCGHCMWGHDCEGRDND